MGTVGTAANGDGVTCGVRVGGMKVGITPALSNVEVAVGGDKTVVGTTIGAIVDNAARVGTNGVGVGAEDPHATSSQKLNIIRRKNGRFITMQSIAKTIPENGRYQD